MNTRKVMFVIQSHMTGHRQKEELYNYKQHTYKNDHWLDKF